MMPLRLELFEQAGADRTLGHLVQLLVVVEHVRQVEHLEFPHAERAELRQRRRQHLHRAELERFHLLAILEQLAVRIDLYLDASVGSLLCQLLESLCALAFRRVDRHDMTELDDDRLLRHRGSRQHGQEDQSQQASS